MAVNDIYVVKQFGQYLGQQCLNTYFYRQVTVLGDTDAFGLWEAMDSAILSELVGCVVTGYTVDQVEVYQILSPTDYYTGTPSNSVGLRSAVASSLAPSSQAFSYRSNRAGAGTRRSYKRYSGMVDTDADGNGLAVAFTSLAPVTNLQAALGAVISAGAQSTYEPVQVAASWVAGLLVTVNFTIASWDAATLTTQTSRKP